MIRITYGDRTYILQPEDNRSRPVRFAPQDVGSWVTVLNVNGCRVEVLSGGTKAEAVRETATPATPEKGQEKA
jgi:hypothetical protein